MKKIFIMVLLLSLFVCGCENKNISKGNIRNCKLTIKAVDQFLDGDLEAKEAYDKIKKYDITFKDALSDECDASERQGRISIDLLDMFSEEENEKIEKLIKDRDELALICGLAKYKN